jgi:O-antigen/teichoic acid export membrane protein
MRFRVQWPAPARVSAWIQALTLFLFAQGLTQALTLTTGLLLVRGLDRPVFALYALATSVLTFLSSFTDLGVTASLVHFYRRALTSGRAFAPFVSAVLRLRRNAMVLAAPIAIVGLVLLNRGRAVSTPLAVLSGLAVVAATWLQMHSSIGVVLLRLANDLPRAYKAEIGGAGVRLAVSALIIAAQGVLGVAAGLIAVAASALGCWVTKEIAKPPASFTSEAESDRRERSEILHFLLPTLPSAVYFSVQGPVLLWLAAWFGDVQLVADVGALSRIGLLLSVFAPIPSVLLLPRLARVVDERLYWRRVLQFGAAYAFLLLLPVLLALVHPEAFLVLLGRQYSQLVDVLPLCLANTSLGIFSGLLVGLTRARGWTRWDTKALTALVGSQIVGVILFRLDDLRGVLLFGTLTTVIGLSAQCVILLVGRRRPWAVGFETRGDA